MKIGGIYLEIRAKRDKLKKDLAAAKSDVERTAIKMEHAFAGALKTGITATGVAVAAFGAAFVTAVKQGVQSSAELERKMLRTEAIIKATGNAAQLTGKQFLAMANRLDLATLNDRDSILGAINAMQTFKSVSGDTFERAIELSVDLAEVLGVDVRSQVVQLGKALEDPITGLTALRRVGVSFTESQKEQIKALVESNKQLEAQGLILDAISEQVGGAAEGAAGGLSGKVDTLSFRWREFTEVLANFTSAGRLVSNVINSMSEALANLSEHLRDPTIQESIAKRINDLQTTLNIYNMGGGSNPNIDPNRIQAQIEQLRQLLFRQIDMERGLPSSARGLRNSDFFLDYPSPAPAKLDRLEYQTELGATSAERGHMAQTEMNRELTNAIQLQNAMALAVEDTYDIDAGIGQYSDLLDDLSDKGIETADVMRDAFTGWASSYSATLTDMIWESELTFDGILESFGRMLTQMVIQQNMTNLVGGAYDFIPTLFKEGAKGMVASGPGISAYSGQVVDRPTVFPFARGIGLMGEAGSEAILPLTRVNGELGVKASGGGVNVIINEAPPGATVKQQNNGDMIDIIVNLNAASVANHGPLARAIESTYGLSRSGRRA